jgi:hypothetical protein
MSVSWPLNIPESKRGVQRPGKMIPLHLTPITISRNAFYVGLYNRAHERINFLKVNYVRESFMVFLFSLKNLALNHTKVVK